MTTWALFPSADKTTAETCRDRWAKRGYLVGIFCDVTKPAPKADYVYQSNYEGYWKSCNILTARVMASRKAEVVTLIGDDMNPDPVYTAQEIAEVYLERFPDGYGILQACGDPQGQDSSGTPAAARICGSPTFGIGWAERGYGGRGPCPTEYSAHWGDEEMWEVAKREGILWLEPKYTFFHRHWSFGHQKKTPWQIKNEPASRKDRRTFLDRKKTGWPGSAPLAKIVDR